MEVYMNIRFLFRIPGSALFIQLCCTGYGARPRADESFAGSFGTDA